MYFRLLVRRSCSWATKKRQKTALSDCPRHIRQEVEWIDRPPETSERTPVHIIIPDNTQQQPPQTDEKTAGELLQTLADMDAFSDITDPVAWQREQRRGRLLPYRDDDAD